MVPDTARLAHAAGGQNHLRRLVFINGPRGVARKRNIKPREPKRIHALSNQLRRRFVAVRQHILTVNVRRLDSQRAVHPHREIVVALHKPRCLDLPDEVEHLLSSSDGKCRYHHVSALIERRLDNLRKLTRIIRPRTVLAHAVGRLNHHIIFIGIRQLRVADERPVAVAEVTGKQHLRDVPALVDRHLNARRAKQVSCVQQAHRHAVNHLHRLVVR